MTGRAARRLRRAFAYARQRLLARPVILLYHRVAEVPNDPWGLCVSPANFAQHLEALGRYGDVLSLRELALALARGRLPRRAVVITFDDGYADNLHTAKPLLERHGFPATVFVATGAIDSGREFWWDELEQVVLAASDLPNRLEIEIGGERFSWAAGSPKPSRGERNELYHALWRRLWPLRPDGRQARLVELARWAGVQATLRESHRTLSSAELRALAEGGLIEIGAHTVTHPALPDLPPDAQAREIGDSKRRCEEILDAPVTTFSYPHGRYGSETVLAVRAARFTVTCCSNVGPVKSRSRPLELPRIMAQDWIAEEFVRHVERGF